MDWDLWALRPADVETYDASLVASFLDVLLFAIVPFCHAYARLQECCHPRLQVLYLLLFAMAPCLQVLYLLLFAMAEPQASALGSVRQPLR